MNNDLEIKIVEAKEKYLLISMSGNINLNTMDLLANHIKDIKKKYHARNYIIDFKNISYISSGGIGIFMDFFEKLEKKGGQIYFIGMSASVRRVFELVGFLQYFHDCATVDVAIAHIENELTI